MKLDWTYLDTPDEHAISDWMRQRQTPCAGVLALLPEQARQAVPMLQTCAAELGLPLLGAVFPELVIQAKFHRQGVLLIGLDPMPAYRLVGGLSGENGRAAAVQALAELVEPTQDTDATLLLLFDGLYDHTASLLGDIYYEVGDACRYAGVNAGSETFQPMPCLFDGQQWLNDAVLALMLPRHPGAVLGHGYQVPDTTLAANATTGNRIDRIDLQPAFKKYAELVHEQYGQTVTRENFYSMGVHFPFALVRADGELLIRIPVAVDDEGALFCVGEVPEGALLTVARAVESGNPDTVARLAADYAALQARAGLFFYCAGRRMHLGEAAAEQELAQLAAALPDQPLLGALTLGEIGNASAGGYPLFHNAALVALPMDVKP